MEAERKIRSDTGKDFGWFWKPAKSGIVIVI